jgi:hypothetical protein
LLVLTGSVHVCGGVALVTQPVSRAAVRSGLASSVTLPSWYNTTKLVPTSSVLPRQLDCFA